MADETYNGWTNWDTWIVALWLGNDEQVYRATQRKFKGRVVSEAGARAWCTTVRKSYPQVRVDWGAQGGKDRPCWSRVCWAEIVDCIKEIAHD